MVPRSSMTIIASGTVSRIDCRCASRASASRVMRMARRRPRCNSSPPQATPIEVTIKAAPLTKPNSDIADGAPSPRNTAATLSIVASKPGPRPPTPAEISTGGMKLPGFRFSATNHVYASEEWREIQAKLSEIAEWEAEGSDHQDNARTVPGRKRGPKPDFKNKTRTAEIVERVAAGGNWADKQIGRAH